MAVLMCSGQGAQKPGMGADLLGVPEVADTFACASDVFHTDFARMAREGSAEQVNETVDAQALTMALSVGVGRALAAHGYPATAMLGFSLGQISALALVGSLSVEDAFRLLDVRAHAMARACKAHPGAMLALLGATHEDAAEVCQKCADGDVLVAANYNCPGQVVLSGSVQAIDRAEGEWKARSKRSVRLATQGAFHSPLMSDAAAELRTFCETIDFAEPRVPLICNTDAKPFKAAEAVDRLSRQLVSPVLFEQSVCALVDAGERRFTEAGFGGVLFNLVKRIDRTIEADLAREKAGTLAEFESLCA